MNWDDDRLKAGERHLSSNPAVVLQPWEPGDEDCVMCDEPHTALGGVDTHLGWICYPCVRWLNELTRDMAFPSLADNPAWRTETDVET
jgi:hypothetical protein